MNFVSAIDQTAMGDGPNVKTTLCASYARNASDAAPGRKKVRCMKKLMTLVAIVGLTSAAWAGTRENVQDRLDNAGRVLHEVMATPDRGIPEEVLEHARCIAVVPHMLKAGFVFGADNGKGVATCRMDGAHRRSLTSRAPVGDCRSASKALTWS
jgi:hypothetical protein